LTGFVKRTGILKPYDFLVEVPAPTTLLPPLLLPRGRSK
jgi:hypothetical protein